MLTDDPVLRTFRERRRALLAGLRDRPRGLAFAEDLSAAADEAVRAVFAETMGDRGLLERVAVAATGGFGRRELAPFSDIDLTVVPLGAPDGRLEAGLKLAYRRLQDLLKDAHLRLGYNLRLTADVPGLDAASLTALLDARLVTGASEPLERLSERLEDGFPTAEFLIAKLDERAAAERRTHDTPLVVCPDLKEGAGGLRSVHAANWIRSALGERPLRPRAAYDFVLTVRNLLQLAADRATDTLTHGRREEVAALLGMEPLWLGERLAAEMTDLHREYQAAVARIREARFELRPGVWAIRGEVRIAADATAEEATIGVAAGTRLRLQVADLPTAVDSRTFGPGALAALASGEETLRNLDRCGVLAAVLPELTSVRCLMPRDATHEFTVFEHTFRVVRGLESVPPESFLGEVMAGLRDRSPLFVAALLHDLGKQDPAQEHSTAGAEFARSVAARWRLDPGTSSLLVWLVREHLTMAKFIRMRDVMNVDTSVEFAQIVRDRERLAMLTLLTWADVNAVAPGTWTPVQETFLRELFVRTQSLLQDDPGAAPEPGILRKRILRQLREEAVPPEELQRFVDSLPAHYVLSTPPDVVRAHLHLARRAAAGEVALEVVDYPELSVTDVTVFCRDAPGLLSRLLGVLYALDLSLVGVRASTTDAEPPVALDMFTVSYGDRCVPPSVLAELDRAVRDVVDGRTTVEELLTARGKDPSRAQEQFTARFVPGEPGILEVRAPRGRGMAFRVARRLAAAGWNILAARVGQWAGSGAASFYVTGPGGAKLTQEDVAQALGD